MTRPNCSLNQLAVFALVFLLVLLSGQAQASTKSKSPIVIPRGCRNRCYRSKGPAFSDCRYRSRPVAGCRLARCQFNSDRKEEGWICENIPSPLPSPSPSISPSSTNKPPIFIPRGCRNRCYRSKSQAFHDCRYRSRPVAGCRIAPCKFNEERKLPGWVCEPIPSVSPSPTSSPLVSPSDRPPIVIPRGCRNRCYRSRGPAFHDCRYKKRPVAGCHITRCNVNPTRKEQGWICAPTMSPSPSASPSPSMIALDSFTSRTFRSEDSFSGFSTVSASDGSSSTYNVSYDVKLPEKGVVSLDGVAEFAKVTCFLNSTVRVQLAPNAPISSISQMYPLGAILIISRDEFGECYLAPATIPENESEEEKGYRMAVDNESLFADGFLEIENVSGTPYDTFISGTSVAYFAIFEKASISVVANPESASSRMLMPVSEKAVNLDFDSSLISVGPLSLDVKGTGQYTGEFVSFKADWDLLGLDVEFKFINQWNLALSFDAKFSAGAGKTFYPKDLLSIPLWAIPPIDFLSKLDTGRFHLPTFKLGFYFEVPLVVTIDVKVEKSFGNVATASYTTSRTEVTLYVRGPFYNIDVGSDTKQLAPRQVDFKYSPSLTATEPIEIVVGVFVGIRPQFIAYVPIFFARASLETGVEIEGKWAPGKSAAFPPVTSGGLKFGRCNDCHDVQIKGAGKVRNAGLFAGLSFKFRYERFGFNFTVKLINKQLVGLTLPGNPSLSVDIATGCYVEPIGDDGPLHFLEAEGQCKECPEDKPRYNPTRKECEEECPDEEKPFFNKATEECEPCPPDAPTYNKKLEVCEANCPGGTSAGNDVPFYGSFELGRANGTFVFQRQHYTVKDRMEVLYEGSVIHDTGCTGGSESKLLTYTGSATNVIVKVTPNCAGTSGTAWNFAVSCPNNS